MSAPAPRGARAPRASKAPAPAPGKAPAPKGKAKAKATPAMNAINIFTRMFPRKKKPKSLKTMKSGRPMRKYGLIRRVFGAAPYWMGALQYRLVMLMDSLVHSVLAALCTAELFGLDVLRGRQSSVLARPQGSARRLMSLLYDSSLGMLQLGLTMPRFFLAFPNDDVMRVLQRIAILQCCLGACLHYTSVVRWKTRSCEYRVPPLLILLAYFLLPWTSICCFLLLLRPGDHKLGSWYVDCLCLAGSAALRVGLFGRYGRPRMPRSPQSLYMRVADAAVLAAVLVILDLGLLRNAWIERRRNWKYVFCLLLLVLPLPFWRSLLHFFREERDGVKKKTPKRDRTTRKEVRAEIYGELRAGVPVDAELPGGVAEKLRQRRAMEGRATSPEVARLVPKLPVLGLVPPSGG